MGSLKRKRVEAPRVATLEDVHPHTKWTMCLRLYHKFHSEMFAPGRKRLYMILLDEGCKKMGAVIYDDEVDRLGPLLVEGQAYYVWRMSARPIYRNQEYLLAEDRDIVCHFTSETIVSEMKQVKEKCIPLFPSFMPFERFWNIAFDDYKRVDIIGMVLYVSDTGFQDSHYNRRIPVKNIVLMDGSFNIITLVVWDNLLTSNLSDWNKSATDRAIVVATMLRPKADDRQLHTTDYSRVYFNPSIAVARELKRRINTDLSGAPSA